MNTSQSDAAANEALLQTILAGASGTSADPHTLFGETSDEFWYWLNTTGYDTNPAARSFLPSLPADVIQLRFTGRSGERTLSEGFKIYQLLKERFEHYNGSLGNSEAVLDFGCGWGRIIRYFLKDVAGERLRGIDVLDDVIAICRETNPWCAFETNAALPPTRFADNTFDFVYCYSVFSHLAEPAHRAWLRELERILKPGGIFIATTRPRNFIEFTASIRALDPMPDWAVNSSTALAFVDTQHWLATYDRGEFCFTPTGGGGGLDSSFFGETCIPEAYVRANWVDYFDVLEYIADRARCEQNVIVVRKRTA